MGRPPGRKNKTANEKSAPKKGRKSAANGQETEREAPSMQAASKAPPSNGPTPEQKAGWMGEYTRLKTQARSIAGDIAALGGRVKSGGGNWKALKQVHDLKKIDTDEAIAYLEEVVGLAAQNNIRVSWVGDQSALTDLLDQNEPLPPGSPEGTSLAEARAQSDGYNSGMLGQVPSDNPFRHKPGSPEYVAWHNGRDSGQKAREKARPEEAARVATAQTADASFPDEGPAHVPPVAAEGIF